jgi:Domain of Unknown Function (DUF913)
MSEAGHPGWGTCGQVSDSPNTLGSNLEELMRHVTALRSEGVEVILTIIRTLCMLGGVEDPIPAPPPPPACSEDMSADAASASPMETDQQGGYANVRQRVLPRREPLCFVVPGSQG